VNWAPCGGDVDIFVVRGRVVCAGEDATVRVGPFRLDFGVLCGQDDAVGAEVVDERLRQGDEAGFGGDGAVSFEESLSFGFSEADE